MVNYDSTYHGIKFNVSLITVTIDTIKCSFINIKDESIIVNIKLWFNYITGTHWLFIIILFIINLY